MRNIYLIVILIGVIALLIGLVLSPGYFPANSEKELAALSFEKQGDSRITIFAVGDIMLDRGVEYMIREKGKGDFKFPFLKIAEDLKEADILFGNLEGPISSQGQKVGSIYSFRMDPRVAEGLKYAGFDVLSLANNHTLDYQRIALEDTMKILKESGIDYVGAGFDRGEAFSVKFREIKGVKIGFLAYTDLGSSSWQAGEDISGMSWIGRQDIEEIEEDVREAKKKVDILIVSLHSGWEYATEPTFFQKEFSQSCIGAGADLVLGHHSHVIQRIEEYGDGWIVYSLGNFIFDQGFSEETMEGLLLEVELVNGKIEGVNPRRIKLSEYFQPYFPDEI